LLVGSMVRAVQLFEHRVSAAGLIEPERAIHRADRIQQPTYSRREALQCSRLPGSRDVELQLVLAGPAIR
jgi:hypothetical protein